STPARLEMALVFLYTTRGIPSLYYGTEQDFNGGSDPNNREDMFDGAFEQGPSLGDNFNMTHPRFKLVAKLNNLRRLYPALRTGTHQMLWVNWNAPGLLAYARRVGTTEEVYVVMNTATSAQTIGARPTIHPAGTVLVNLLNPAETYTVVAGTDGIPSMSIPASSYKMLVAQSQYSSLQPVIASATPSHDSTGVSVASTVSLTFSQVMNTASVETAFSTTPDSTGTFVWTSGNTVMTYTPSSNLAGNTLYTVRIESSATDFNSLAMQGAFESRFTTGAASSLARPSINSASSANLAETTATLTATVTPNGAATTVSFEYGTSPSFGSSTAGQSIGSGNSPVAVNANLTGLQANTTYYFRAVGTNSQGTTTGNTLTFTTTTALPLVTTIAAGYVMPYTASLNGDVTPNGLNTSVYFEWGDRSDVLSLSNSPEAIGSGTNLVAKWAAIANLSPDSTYFFRIVAMNVNNNITNKTYGATLSFKTLSVKPMVTTLGTTNVVTTAATFQGTVNPNGSQTSFFFEYGSTPSYGSTTTTQDAGSGSNSVALSAALTGLSAGQVYYYRAAASNSFGVSYGTDQSFYTGYPPPSVTTLTPASPTMNSVQLRGSVNPNNSYASSWFEWGTTTNYGSTSRILASDGAENYSNFNFTSPNNNGGSGLGTFNRFSAATDAGTFLANNSSNQTIDGAKSFGAYAGSGAGISFRRTVSTPRQFGTMSVSARFNVNNAKGFSGFNLKSTAGSGSSGFSSGELVRFGISPSSGNNGILVTDASGTRTLDLGANVRSTIIDFQVDFDALNRRYVVGAKFRTNSAFTRISGTMSGTGTNVTHIGFAAWNSEGSFQDLMFDNLEVRGSVPMGIGTNSATVSNSLTGLSSNTIYNYRVAAMNLDGGVSSGANTTFVTGPDLAVSASHTGDPWLRGGTGSYTLAITNSGSLSSSGTVTVTAVLPAGLSVTGGSGTGWTMNLTNLTATRATALASGAAYPSITLNVAVATNAAASLTPTFAVSGGGDANADNNSATDSTSTLSALESWRKQMFGVAENIGSGADTNTPAGDGVPNLIKYALGLNPLLPTTNGLPVPVITNHRLALSFNRQKSATDIVYEVEASGDVFGWGSIWSSGTNSYSGGTNAAQTVTVEDSVTIESTNRRFLRLRITRP
ncbi:MAG: Ig-like domain-containing protein, partial [Verrucomicrobia bacterium]|nr:Ig-like domain-containing protein [Verrucomicrobiota bacterium]